jgi:hypothetical protein
MGGIVGRETADTQAFMPAGGARPCTETRGDSGSLPQATGHAVVRSSAGSGSEWDGIGWGTPPIGKGSA